MGMTSDQNENVSFAEQAEQRKLEEAKKANEKKMPHHSIISSFDFKGKTYQLLVGDDKKWYKSEWIGKKRFDDLNRTPMVDIYSEEILPLTKEEYDYIFITKKKIVKKR